jgi:FKBP-type peptidyl-prolyl cis-trans isomerase FkpA
MKKPLKHFHVSPFHFGMVAVFVVFVFSGQGCGSKYPGFTKTSGGIYYSLFQIGEDSLRAGYGDFITADIAYSTMNDSIFFSGRRKFELEKPTFPGSVNECFTILGKGDSAAFIIPANDFFIRTLGSNLPTFFKEQDLMKFSCSVIDIQTRKEFEHEKEAFLKWIEDFNEYEKVLLKQFIEESRLGAKQDSSGLYYLKLVAGNGKKVRKGDTLTVDYEGKFLNGKFFDSTVKRLEPFQFVYGQEWQVVKGLEEGIGQMEEGEKALFILPSDLAFGREGSSTGVIPPYTSLLFEVRLLKITPGDTLTQP